MRNISLIDTSVYLNILDVAGFNQDRATILPEVTRRIEQTTLLLPFVVILESGNHISKLPDGRVRRKCATRLVTDVARAVNGETPYAPTYFPARSEFLGWLADFPDFAMRNRSSSKPHLGISLADYSIIKEWERTRELNPTKRVTIWSLDSDLGAYS